MPEHDPDCIFCRIVKGEIPCHRLHEDDQVLAFLDVGPLSPGHTLVIPKAHYERLEEMPADVAGACLAAAPRLARAIQAATGIRDYNVLQNNGKAAHQAVNHVHVHIIPRPAGRDAGLDINWPAGKLTNEQGQALRQQIAQALDAASQSTT